MLSEVDQRREIVESRQRIERETGVQPTVFAAPNGDFNEATLGILRAEGVQAACTTIRGINTPGTDPLLLRRIGVGSDSIPVLASRLAGLFDENVRRWLRRGPKSWPAGGIR